MTLQLDTGKHCCRALSDTAVVHWQTL